MSIKKGITKFGSRFAFEFFLETMHGPMINGLREYLRDIKAEDIPDMVKKEKFPPLDHLDLSFVGENIEHIGKISLVRLVEFIAEARPDLIEAIQNRGEAGAAYLAKLRQHMLNRIKGAEFKPEQDMVIVTCDKCKRQIPMPRDKAANLTECPFCHAPAGGEEKAEDEPEPQ